MCMPSSKPPTPPPPPPPPPAPVMLEQEAPKKPQAEKDKLADKKAGNKQYRKNYTPTSGGHIQTMTSPGLSGIKKP